MMLTKKLTNLGVALVLACWYGSVSACDFAQTKSAATTLAAPKQDDDSNQYSNSVSAGGADFEIVAGRAWHRPGKIYDEVEASIGLRITNRGDKELIFNLGDTLKVGLKSADGKELVQVGVPKNFLPARPVRVAAGKSENVTLPTHLFHTRISAVCLGLKGGAGWCWLTNDLQPGKYRLSLHYENQQKDNGCWLGKVQTETVEIEVKAAKK